MTVSWKSWPNLFYICLSLCGTGVMSQILNLEPQNSTVLKGTDARFIVTVLGKWEVMAWSIRDLLVIVIYAPSGSTVTSSDQFSATFWTAGDTSCVEFTIHNVTRNQTGEITCRVLGTFGSQMAQLNVEESGTVSITGASLSVMQDQQVEFQCITSAWYPEPIVGWRLNGVAFNSSNTTIMTDGVSFDSTSVLTFQAVSNTTVECWATVASLSIPISSSVFLVVVPKPPDWTVLIAVVSSIGGFALLVLLIIGLIFCYKRWKRKQPNYKDELARRVRSQSDLSGVNATGQVNAGYVSEGVAPSEFSNSDFSLATGSRIFEMPDIVNSNQASPYINVDESGFKKHRHVTIV